MVFVPGGNPARIDSTRKQPGCLNGKPLTTPLDSEPLFIYHTTVQHNQLNRSRRGMSLPRLHLTSLCWTSPIAAGSDTALAALTGACAPSAPPPPTTGGWYPPCGAAGGGGEGLRYCWTGASAAGAGATEGGVYPDCCSCAGAGGWYPDCCAGAARETQRCKSQTSTIEKRDQHQHKVVVGTHGWSWLVGAGKNNRPAEIRKQ